MKCWKAERIPSSLFIKRNVFQNEVNECKYGILNVRAYYNASAQTLVLDGKIQYTK